MQSQCSARIGVTRSSDHFGLQRALVVEVDEEIGRQQRRASIRKIEAALPTPPAPTAAAAAESAAAKPRTLAGTIAPWRLQSLYCDDVYVDRGLDKAAAMKDKNELFTLLLEYHADMRMAFRWCACAPNSQSVFALRLQSVLTTLESSASSDRALEYRVIPQDLTRCQLLYTTGTRAHGQSWSLATVRVLNVAL